MIYLASKSPRRAELLRQIGIEFAVQALDIDESRGPTESPTEYVSRMAKTKAAVVAEQLDGQPEPYAVLAADTTIAVDGDTIGKPANSEQCHSILQQLSGRQLLRIHSMT